MRGSRIKPDFGVLIVSALGVALLGGPNTGDASEGNFSEWKIAQVPPRKDAPKAAQPSGTPPPGAKPIATADVCDPATRNLVAISAALNQGAPQVQKTCATTASPARIKLVGATNRAIVVRPLSGDVDALLNRNNEVIDFSMNTRRRAELVLLPLAGEFELVVSTESATATFEIGVVQLASAVDKKTLNERTAPAPQAANADEVPPPWVPGVFRDLGYDLIDPASSADDPANPVDPRTIMAFQAGEKFEVTGKLGLKQVEVLASQVALQIDIAALEAVKTSRRISQNSPVVPFPDPPSQQPATDPPNPAKNPASKKGVAPQDDQPDPPEPLSGLKSMKGAFYNGKFFGLGILRSGSQFEGEWLDGPTVGDSPRPALGILSSVNECSAAIKTYGMAAASGEAVVDEAAIIGSSIGVMRQKNKKIFSGDLNQAGEKLQSCTPNSSH